MAVLADRRRSPPTWSPWSPARTTSSSSDGHGGSVELGIYCRESLAQYLDADELFDAHPAGPRLLRGGVRLPLPVRQVRPALRARVQLRRHGEPGLRDLQRVHGLPLPPDRGRPRGPGQHPAARDGPHVVRRPGDHAVVGRPVAERELRHLHGHPRAWPRPPGSPTPGCGSPPASRPAPWPRTSCPRRTPSRPTSSTPTRSASTSTASPTPRARRRCKQLVAWVGPGRLPPGPAQLLPRVTSGATPSWPTSSPRSSRPAGASSTTWSEEWLETAGVNTLRADFELRRGRHLRLVRHRAGRPAAATTPCARTGWPSASTDLARRRRSCGDSGSSSTWSATRTEVAELAGEPVARPAPAQRRRPHLRQDPPRRALAAHPGRPPERHRRPAGPHPLLGRHLGHGARRRAGHPALRLLRPGPRRRPSPTTQPCSAPPRPGGQRHRRLRRPGQPRRGPSRAWPPQPAPASTAPSRAPTASSSGPATCSPSASRPTTWPTPGPCSTAPRRSRGWPSTPTCAGRSSWPWPPRAPTTTAP